MKSIFAAILVVAFAAGCKKNSFFVTERTLPEGNALVKIALFSTSISTVNVLISVNGDRVSNPQPNFNAAFPGGGFNTNGNTYSDFLIVTPGQMTVSLDVPNIGTPVVNYNYYEGSAAVEANKRYVFFVTDTATNTTSFLVNVDSPTPDSGYVAMKFAHGMPNVPAVDVYKGPSASTATLLASNIAYKASSNFVLFAPGTDSIFARVAGSPATSEPVARRAFTFTNQRIYAIATRGYYQAGTPLAGNRGQTMSGLQIQ
jgi:hypothetical protein